LCALKNPNESICDLTTGACIQCITNEDCPMDNPVCNSNICGDCNDDDQCSHLSESAKCVNTECVLACTTNDDCPEMYPFCDSDYVSVSDGRCLNRCNDSEGNDLCPESHTCDVYECVCEYPGC